MWNARVKWTRGSRLLFNTYRGYAASILKGTTDHILSKEGITQGDPLSMLMYAIAVLPLTQALSDHTKWNQNWYADDSACAGSFSRLGEWFEKLLDLGPDFGYYPEPTKTILVIDSKDETEANFLSEKFGFKVVTGQRFLGGFIGNDESTFEYLEGKVRSWESCVEKLASAAESQPQAVHAAFARSLQFEWCHLQRIVQNCGSAFKPLQDIINNRLLPAIFGGSISNIEKSIISLPARMGGMGIRDPVETARLSYLTSKVSSTQIISAIKGEKDFCSQSHNEEIYKTKAFFRKEQHIQDKQS